MTDYEMIPVRVWPDDTNQLMEEPPFPHKSDDFKVRLSDVCSHCHQVYELDYEGPFAHCQCGTTEWYS